MSDSTLPKFLAYGTNAQRLAFTPAPATLTGAPYQLYVWRETDTGHLFAYDTAWHDLGPAVAIGTNVQAWDVDLDALAALSSTGLIARTGAGTVAARTLTAPAAGVTVSNGDGVSGNPTLALANDLAALEALSGTNTLYYRSGADTWSAVTIGSNLTFSGGTLSASSVGGGGLLAANNLSDVASASTSRTNLGVAIGSNVQAWDADLDALAALSGTNTIYYRSAANTWSAVTISTGLAFSGGNLTATGVAGGAITGSGLTMATARLLGRTTASSGAIEELTTGTGLVLSAGSLAVDTGTSGAKVPLLNGANTHSGLATFSAGADLTPATTPSTTAVGYLGSPQNIVSGAYTTVMSDAGKHLYHTSATAHTITIDSNANVAYPVGTILTFINENGGGVVTLAITSDTLRWGSSTGSRTLAANGTATAIKVASTTWRLTGDGIT